jgi:2,4-dienoyl-CoA reductase (NADPH2)
MYQAETVERLRELCTRGTKKVTIFEMLPKAAQDVGRSTRWVLMGSVTRYGINVITGAKVLSVKNGQVNFEKDGKIDTTQFDTVVNAVGSRSVRKIADAIEKTGIPCTVIGDGKKVAQIDKAIHDGFLAVMNLS